MNTREEAWAFEANGGKGRVNAVDPFLKRSSVMSPLRFDKNKIYIRIFVIASAIGRQKLNTAHTILFLPMTLVSVRL